MYKRFIRSLIETLDILIAVSEAYTIGFSFVFLSLPQYLAIQQEFAPQQIGLVLITVQSIGFAIKIAGFIILLVGMYKTVK